MVNDATPDPGALGIPILKADPNPGGLERAGVPAVGPQPAAPLGIDLRGAEVMCQRPL